MDGRDNNTKNRTEKHRLSREYPCIKQFKVKSQKLKTAGRFFEALRYLGIPISPFIGNVISIILPFTNEQQLLQEAIDSILLQSFTDFELLLIDNGSDAWSRGIAVNATTTDSRIKLLTEPKRGIAQALNTGIAAAHAPFLARMDADDRMHPDRLKFQVEHLNRNPDIGVVAGRTVVFPIHTTNEGYRRFVDWQNTILSPNDHFRNRFIEAPVAHPSVMMRREVLERHGMYTTDPFPEDYELWLRWMDAGVRFEKLPDVLLEWRDRPDRLSRSHSNYDEERFFEIKAYWLKRWMDKHVEAQRPVIVCGGSKNIRPKVARLEAAGIKITAITDVVTRTTAPRPFIPAMELENHRDHFIINLIAKRDVRESIRAFIHGQGFVEMQDFVMAG